MLHLIMNDILGTPAILVGLFALLGLLLQKKGPADIISGTLKTIMGFIILGAGANVLVGALSIFSEMFNHAFHIKGTIPNNEAIVALAQKNIWCRNSDDYGIWYDCEYLTCSFYKI